MIVQAEADNPVEELQRQLFAVIGGRDPAQVLILVEKQQAIIERELTEVPKRAEARGEEFLAYIAEVKGRLLQALERYQAWLGEARQALEAYDTHSIMVCHEESSEVIPNLLETLEEYSNKFASFGPYPSPVSNGIFLNAEAVVAGQIGTQEWRSILESYGTTLKARGEEVKTTTLPGRFACQRAFERTLGCLEQLKALDSVAAYKLPLDAFDLALQEAEKVEHLITTSSQGPTKIPSTNVVVAVVRKMLEGELGLEVVESCLEDYCEQLDSFWEGFERSLSRPIDSALVQEEIPRTLESADAHDAAVEELAEALPSKEKEQLEQALEKLIESASRLNDTREVYETASQHQSHIICPACGRANPPENKVCEACGQPLPRMDEDLKLNSSTFTAFSGPALEDSQQLEMTENVARLFNACDAVAVQEITLEEFQAILVEADNDLKEFSQDLDEVAVEAFDDSDWPEEMKEVFRTQHLPYVQEVAVQFTDGIEQVSQGLQTLAQYLQVQNDETLVEGMRTIWEGLGTIHRASLSMQEATNQLSDILDEAREEGLLTEEG